MYIDMKVLDQECIRLACLMAERGMEHVTLPAARTPQEEGAALEAEFSQELGRSYARIAAAGSDEECILPSLLMEMAGKLSTLATELSLRDDRDAAEVIRTIGGR
ncbi:hypothetical protein ACIOEZ_32185 [Streptomyces sp. NPDC087866]|uniref:hypothetical protein n=1 Tax=Streptomyces sp. NPDC087866 TaxID=3365815 RepID=UPI00382697F3